MSYSIAKKIFILSLIFISGCQQISAKSESKIESTTSSTSDVASGECPEQPDVVLDSQTVEPISFENRQATLSGIAKKNQTLGYTFEAKSGQKFNYQTDEDICVWIYTPDNQLLSSKNLPVDGNYTVQVSAPQGSKTFELEIGLETETALEPEIETNYRDLTGIWKGSFGLNHSSESTLEIVQKSDEIFEGTLTTVGKEGGLYKIAVQGFIDWKTKQLSIQETRIISKPSRGVWFLGSNEGKLTSDHQQIIGTGKDPRGNKYTWLFSKTNNSVSQINQNQTTQKSLNSSTPLQSENLYVALEIVNVYREPSIESEMVTQALHGEPAKIINRQGSWIQVSLPDQFDYQGWIQVSALKNVSSNQDWSNRMIVSAPRVKVRNDAKESASVVSELSLGTVVASSHSSNQFTGVKLVNGDTGYVLTQHLLPYSKSNSAKVTSNQILATAKQLLEQPYLWGGMTTAGVDCSGFIHTVFKVHGIRLHRDTDLQYAHDGFKVTSKQLQPGDLVFFETYKAGPSHIGIYVGDRQFIHASSSRGVSYDSLDSSYYASRFLGAKRVISNQASSNT